MNTPKKRYTRALTIAGSDSGGGAGIQADLKTFAACGCFGMSAITAVTAQNTRGVSAIHALPPELIAAQIKAVLEDIGADAIKIGMLHSVEVVETVAASLARFASIPLVVDPVMVATSGDRLIEENAVAALKANLLPTATLITPNLAEAEILAGVQIITPAQMEDAARGLGRELGVHVLVKGGHLEGDTLVDILFDHNDNTIRHLPQQRIDTNNSHGTGCTLSSAIAAFLGRGRQLSAAVELARDYLHGAIAAGAQYSTGKGAGPVHHFHHFW